MANIPNPKPADSLEKPSPQLPIGEPRQRPALGLALGGGIARGWAHIGVLQRLEELGVNPGVVCGTSVGALVGGFWLTGRLDALEAWTRGLNKRRLVSYLDVVLNGAGLIGGLRLEKTLQRFLPDIMIEDLPARYVAVTTELVSGHETWLRKGSLADAIQAAYALPGIFPPRKIDNRWLIDGALVNPLPVSVCRALDARVVIAVGLHAGAFLSQAKTLQEKYRHPPTEEVSKSERTGILSKIPDGIVRNALLARFAGQPSDQAADPLPNLGDVMFSSFNIMMDRTTRSRLAADPADILITPNVSHIPLFGFDQADELIRLGRQAVDQRADDILLAVDQAA